MASHAHEDCQSGNKLGHQSRSCVQSLTMGLLLFHAIPAAAGVWDIIPRVSVAEIYTDNIDLEPENEQDALITEITPGLSLRGESGRFQAALDYQMQNFFSSEIDGSTSTSHQLNANSTAELLENFLFFDAGAKMGQSAINADSTIALSNYSDDRNRTDVFSYTLSPYVKPRFSSFADGTLRYSHSEVNYGDSSSSSSTGRSGARDSTVTRVDAKLASGRLFKAVSWSANYSNRDIDRESGTDDTFEEANGAARYRITDTFSLVAQAGWSNNDFESSRAVENGTYWAAGGFWQPSRFYSMEALKGNNLVTASLGLYPTVRTTLRINYRDRDVGLNPGEVWSGSLAHRTRRSNWQVGYLEDTTTTQEEELQAGQGFLEVDPVTGLVNPNPQPGDVVVTVPLPPIVTLTDEVTERKRAFGSVGVKTGKTGIRVNLFHEQRNFQESGEEETTRGISGSWDRRLAPRTNWILTGSWQRIDRDDGIDRDFWYVQPQVTRQIRQRLDGSLAYRFTRQDSDDDRSDYDENSVIARITAYF